MGIPVLIVLAITASAGASGPLASESGKTPLLIANCFKPKFKPINVIIACGDASLGARELTWSSWTKKCAHGTGTGQVNDCTPDCVHGTTRTAPIQLLLGKPRICANGQPALREAPLHLDLGAARPAAPRPARCPSAASSRPLVGVNH